MRLASDDVDLSLFEEDATSRFLVLSERASPHRVQLKLPSGKPMTAFYYQGTLPTKHRKRKLIFLHLRSAGLRTRTVPF